MPPSLLRVRHGRPPISECSAPPSPALPPHGLSPSLPDLWFLRYNQMRGRPLRGTWYRPNAPVTFGRSYSYKFVRQKSDIDVANRKIPSFLVNSLWISSPYSGSASGFSLHDLSTFGDERAPKYLDGISWGTIPVYCAISLRAAPLSKYPALRAVFTFSVFPGALIAAGGA